MEPTPLVAALPMAFVPYEAWLKPWGVPGHVGRACGPAELRTVRVALAVGAMPGRLPAFLGAALFAIASYRTGEHPCGFLRRRGGRSRSDRGAEFGGSLPRAPLSAGRRRRGHGACGVDPHGRRGGRDAHRTLGAAAGGRNRVATFARTRRATRTATASTIWRNSPERTKPSGLRSTRDSCSTGAMAPSRCRTWPPSRNCRTSALTLSTAT